MFRALRQRVNTLLDIIAYYPIAHVAISRTPPQFFPANTTAFVTGDAVSGFLTRTPPRHFAK
jgi:hypothetical protein